MFIVYYSSDTPSALKTHNRTAGSQMATSHTAR